MNPERKPSKLGLVPRAVAAGAIGLFPQVVHSTDLSTRTFVSQNVDTGLLNVSNANSHNTVVQETSENEEISHFLEDNKLRALIAASLLTSIAATYFAYKFSKKHDDDLLATIHRTSPLLMSAAFASLMVDSFATVDRHIPAGLFAGSLFLQAGYNLVNIYQRDATDEIRRPALATSAGLITVGLMLLYVADQL